MSCEHGVIGACGLCSAHAMAMAQLQKTPADVIADLRTRLTTAERELERYKEAVAEQLHYDMKALLSGTPEGRMKAERDEARGKLAVAEEGVECAALHARSAVKSWEDGNEHTVTHVRDAENAALVCDGVLARIRGDK